MDDKGNLDFNSISFEKKLTNLKDSQESINICCQWCLANRQYHKKIVTSWLNVLKRVKIDQRLILFYLANDVIQYSKRRNYEFVECWGTTLQKATTMVRDEKIKHKILRIFKIWEQRGVYSEEFISDLCGLISATPTGKKNDEPHEFQSSYLIQKIKVCTQLEGDTDAKLNALKEHNPKMKIENDLLIAPLKDRAHIDDVEKEVDDYDTHMENYINALKLEIKARIHLISLLMQAEKALENDKKDVKTVTSAYKAFSARVKTLKKKLDEKIPTLSSPPPSPDINAPSPEPDSDIDLPVTDSSQHTPNTPQTPTTTTGPADLFTDAAVLYTNAGYYNPVPPPTPITDSSASFNNHFSTFIGSDLSFNLESLRKSFQSDYKGGTNPVANASSVPQTTNSYNINDAISSLFPSVAFPPPPPSTLSPTSDSSNFQYGNITHIPLQPPPMPPFNKTNNMPSGTRFPETFNGRNVNAEAVSPFHSSSTDYQVPSVSISTPYSTSSRETNYRSPISGTFSTNEEYNPEEELETWAPEPTWDALPPVEMDTPESPPMYEKSGYGDPIEYREGVTLGNIEDVDHRVLPGEDLLSRTGDIDHRNLISLTDSPNNQDQDYRNNTSRLERISNSADQEYRASFNMDNFKLPPPPPPPPKMPPDEMLNDINAFNTYTQLPLQNHMNYINSQVPNMNTIPHMLPKGFRFPQDRLLNEGMNINIGLNDRGSENCLSGGSDSEMEDVGMNILRNPSPEHDNFESSPPFPDLLNDVDANQFLDDVKDDLEEFETGDLDNFDQLPMSSVNFNAQNEGPFIFPVNYANPPNSNLINQEMLVQPPWMNIANPNFTNHPLQFQGFPNQGGIILGNFNNRGFRGGRGNWGFIRGYNSEFRGRRGLRGGPGFRGGRSRGIRGRGDFRENYRDSF